ncbi:MAG: hypothetical protein HYY96_15330 [Candidatus Tectomicrobia bacterium]|nr:hypothetical protein [Candidatus Tectomicrobia bacterium]
MPSSRRLKRLILGISVVLVAITALAVWQYYDDLLAHEHYQLVMDQHQALHQVGSSLAAYVETLRREISELTTNEAFVLFPEVRRGVLQQKFTSWRDRQDQFSNIAIAFINAAGRVDIALPELPSAVEGSSLLERPYFRKARQDLQPSLSFVMESLAGARWLTIAVPAVSFEGTFEGLIQVMIPLNYLVNRFFLPARLRQHGDILLANKEGRILLYTKAESIGKNLREGTEELSGEARQALQRLLQEALANLSGQAILEWDADGKAAPLQKYVSYERLLLLEQEFILFAANGETDLAGGLRGSLWRFVLILTAIAGLGVALASIGLNAVEKRTAAADALRERENLAELMSIMGTRLYLIDRRMRVLWSFTGGAEKTAEGPCQTVIWGHKRLCETCSVPLVFESGKTQTMEFRDDEQTWWRATAFPVRRDDEIVAVFELLVEITAEKSREMEMERSRVMAQRAEQLAIVSQLASGIVHDAINPLNLISLRAQSQLLMNPTGEEAEFLHRVVATVERVAGLLDKLRRLSKTQHPERTAVDLVALASRCLELVQPKLREKGIQVVQHFLHNLPMVHADASALEQVLLNLILNALDAMPEGGILTLAAEVEATNGHRSALLSVADTGVGIPAENLRRIFEPFFTTKGERGTGLGLFMSKSLIEANHGEIRVESEPNKGTAFHLALPI